MSITFNDLLTDPKYREMSLQDLTGIIVTPYICSTELITEGRKYFNLKEGQIFSEVLFNHLQKLKANYNGSKPAIFIPNSGDMVEVSDDGEIWGERKFIYYHEITKQYVTILDGFIAAWKHCRPIKTKVTIAELLECYATAKGLKVDNLEQI